MNRDFRAIPRVAWLAPLLVATPLGFEYVYGPQPRITRRSLRSRRFILGWLAIDPYGTTLKSQVPCSVFLRAEGTSANQPRVE